MIDTCTALDMCAIHVFIHEVVSSACHSVYLHSRFHRVSETAGGGAGGGAGLQLGDPTLMVLGTGVLGTQDSQDSRAPSPLRSKD